MSKTRRKGFKLGARPSLNFIAAIVATAGFFSPFFMFTPDRFAADSMGMVADAGASLSASVPSNPYNTLAQQLHDKEQLLNEREAALDSKKSPWILSAGEIFGLISFLLSLVLCILIGLNFYLDWRRGKKPGMLSRKFSVDLRA